MQLRLLTLEHCKKINKIKKTTINQLSSKLASAEAKGESNQAEEIRDQIKNFEQDFLQKEWDKQQKFTFLEDERPKKSFLNIESKKMGYNEITKLNISKDEKQ